VEKIPRGAPVATCSCSIVELWHISLTSPPNPIETSDGTHYDYIFVERGGGEKAKPDRKRMSSFTKHTQTYIYIYIYVGGERDREKETAIARLNQKNRLTID